jgi:hypothetical protein
MAAIGVRVAETKNAIRIVSPMKYAAAVAIAAPTMPMCGTSAHETERQIVAETIALASATSGLPRLSVKKFEIGLPMDMMRTPTSSTRSAGTRGKYAAP